MPDIHHIAAYRFVELDELPSLRDHIHTLAAAQDLRGTVLLAPEGINLMLAGSGLAVDLFLAELASDSRFAAMDVKRSTTSDMPFGKLLVKIKREIIRMNQLGVRPSEGRAPAIAPERLAQWLDQGHDDAGRQVVMLDTRNDFEVDVGRFGGAVDWRLRRFSDFPAAFGEQRKQLAEKTVVSYCTGGIRCEKAALWMQAQGLSNVWQLDGGILGYFASVGAKHFEGDCFVFDGRVALDAELAPQARRVAAT